MVQLDMQTAFPEIDFDQRNEFFKAFLIPDRLFVHGKIHDRIAAHDPGRVHVSDSKQMGSHAVAVLAVGLSAAEQQGTAGDASVRSGLSQRSILGEMQSVSGEVAEIERMAENVGAAVGEVVNRSIEPVGNTVGEFVVIAEEFPFAQDFRAQIFISFPVGVQCCEQFGHGAEFFLVNELADDAQGVDEVGRTHEIGAPSGAGRAALRHAQGTFDAAGHEQGSQHIAVARTQHVEAVGIRQDRFQVAVKFLLVNGIERIEIGTHQHFFPAVVQGIHQRTHDVRGIAAEGNAALESRLVAADHDIVVSSLPRNFVDLHQCVDAGLVVDQCNAFVFVFPFAVQDFVKHGTRSVFIPAERDLRTDQIGFHQRIENQFGKFVPGALMVDGITADDEMGFRSLVPVRGAETSVTVDHHVKFLKQFLGMFFGERAVRDSLLIERIKILVGTPDAVRLEDEAEIKTLYRFLEIPGGMFGDLHAVGGHAQKGGFAGGIGAGKSLFPAFGGILLRPADDPADHGFQSGEEIQPRKFGLVIPARFDDLFAEPFQPEADHFAEIGVGMLPFERAKIFLGFKVKFGRCFIKKTMSRPGKQVGFHGTVEMDHAEQFVVLREITRLCFHVFGKTLGDPQRIGQFQVEFIIFDFLTRRKYFSCPGGFH